MNAPPTTEAVPQPIPVEPGRRALRMAASNWPFLLLLAAGIALRVVEAFAYRPALPFRNNDAYAYLYRSITMSPVDSFHPFLYSVLIKPLILTGDVTWVTLVQHLAALAMAVLVYLLLSRLGLGPVAAALAAAPVLLDGFQLDIEHQILSEAFFQLFIVSALVILAWNVRPRIPAAAAVGILIGLSSLIRFAGLVVILAAVAYGLLRRMGWIRVAVLVGGFLLTLTVYGVWFQSQTGTFGITNRNGFFLYGRVVAFADCRQVTVPDDLRVFCPRHPGQTSGGGLFRSGLPDRIRKDPAFNSKAMEFSRRMILAKPGAYVAAVLSDFTKYFRVGQPSDSKMWRFPMILTNRDQRRVPLGIEAHFRLNTGLAGFLRRYQSLLWVYGPMLGVLLVLGVAGGGFGLVRGGLRTLAPEAWLFTVAAVGLLIFAPVFAVYHFRYVLPAIPLTGPAAVLGVAAAMARHRREQKDDVLVGGSAPELEAGLRPTPSSGEPEQGDPPDLHRFDAQHRTRQRHGPGRDVPEDDGPDAVR